MHVQCMREMNLGTERPAEMWPGRHAGKLKFHAFNLKAIKGPCLLLELSSPLDCIEKRSCLYSVQRKSYRVY